jgi:hypothetical protein
MTESSTGVNRTIGDVLSECLRLLGATRSFGADPIPGLEHVVVDDPALARLLAAADGRLGPGPGVAWLDGQHLVLTSQPGVSIDPWVVSDPVRLAAALATWTVGEVHAVSEYRVDLDLGAGAPDDVEPIRLDTPVEMMTLHPSLAELHTLVLAGPGVVHQGQVGALQAFAAQAGVGVLNTWGAKGVFPWDSPFHLGTGGMQERDFELAGFPEAELVIAVGVDEDEAPPVRWEYGQVLQVQPESLASLAFGWEPPVRTPARPPLYTELQAALRSHYESNDVPLRPARAAADIAEVRPRGGLVTADAGPAGPWIARAFPTTEPGSVVVPATRARGFAAAAALVAALDDRPAVAITTDPVDPVTEEVLDLARSLGRPLVLEVWGSDQALSSPGEHRERLLGALASGEVAVLGVPVDFAHTRTLVEVAGPVVAWGGDGPGAP